MIDYTTLKKPLLISGAVVVVTLLSVVGYVVWRQQSSPSSAPSKPRQELSPQAAAADDSLKRRVCMKHERLCVRYPASWSVRVTEVALSRDTSGAVIVGDSVELRAADGRTVRLLSSLGRATEQCVPGSSAEVQVLKRRAVKLIEADEPAANTPIIYAISKVQQTTPDQTANYEPAIGLTDDQQLTQASPVDDCAAKRFGVLKGKHTPGNIAVAINTSTALLNPDGASSRQPEAYSTARRAKEVLEQPSYRQAFEIIASAHYKKDAASDAILDR